MNTDVLKQSDSAFKAFRHTYQMAITQATVSKHPITETFFFRRKVVCNKGKL